MTHTHETDPRPACPSQGSCILHPSVSDRMAALRAGDGRCPSCGGTVTARTTNELWDALDLMNRPRSVQEWHAAQHQARAQQLGVAR